MKKAIVAGHICVDITPAFPEKCGSIDTIFSPGKLIEVGQATVSSGGAVANTGLAMKKLGADVALMGKAGTDAFGDMLDAILNEHGLSDSLIRSSEGSTSYSVVLSIPGTDRIFLHHPGVNNSFYASDIPESALQETALFHFGYPPIMHSMYENQGAELLTLMQRAKNAGCVTSLDMAAVDPDSDAGKADWKMILENVLPYVDLFVPSVEELCFMLDGERYADWKTRAKGQDVTSVLQIEEDVKPLAKTCLAMGAKVVLLKCGAPGLYLLTASVNKLKEVFGSLETDAGSWADKEIFEPSYLPDHLVCATGAGDTSIAAFLTAILNGEDPEMCMHLAAATGACCVEAYDALSGLKTFPELKQKIAQGWKKQKP